MTESGTGGQPDLEFADPNRLSALASLYAQLATGDRVRSQLPEKPKPAQIDAIALEGKRQHPASGRQAHHAGGQRRGARGASTSTPCRRSRRS